MRSLQTARASYIVDATNTIRVYDSIAGHYTTCHSLSVGQARYILGRAK